ncbi:MAG TPA: hypothetical protein PKM04_01755, partial [Accumulibacter sp.]|nr:hypothetical protein [Accumulibacter sp.]
MIELLRRGQKGFEMDRIFLVPEQRRHLSAAAPLQHRTQLVAQSADLAVPEFVLAAPSRLDEEQIRFETGQLSDRPLRRQREEIAFGLVAVEGEFVHHASHLDRLQGKLRTVAAALAAQ